MPQLMVYLTPERDVKVMRLKKTWEMSKIDVIQKILNDFIDNQPGLEVSENE